MRFNFVGTFDIDDTEAKVPGYSNGKTKSGIPYVRVNPKVVAGKANIAFCEAFGMKNDPIKAKDKDGNKIEVNYADAKDKGIIDTVAFFCRNTIDFDGKRSDYISDYDFVQQIWNGSDEYKGKRFVFTGDVTKNVYNGKITDRFAIKNIYQIDADDPRKNIFEVTGEFFWNKDSIDTADFKSEKRIYFDGWTREYIQKKEKAKEDDPDYQYMPMKAVFDCSKVNFENEKHVKIMNFRLKNLGLLYEDGKIVNNLKKGKVYKNNIVFSYNRGAEEIEFDASQLTKAQKEAVELGIKKVEDFAPNNNIYGNFKEEYRIKDFPMKDEFSNGMVTLEDSWSDFEDNIYLPVASKEEEKEFEEAVNPPEEEKTDDDEDLSEEALDSLFD